MAGATVGKNTMGTLLQDLRYAIRGLLRSPGFTAVTVLTLGLGIGANTAIFSLVNTLLLRPLPFSEPERLVRMRDAVARPGREPWLYNTSTRSFVEMRERAAVFDGIVAQRHRIFNVTGDANPARITGLGVSSNWLATLGVEPVMGRGFSAQEEREGRNSRVVVIGYGLWQRRFGGRTEVLGRTLNLNGAPYAIIGVMPPRFNFPYGGELWVPETFDRSSPNFDPHVTARISSGLTLQEAQVGLNELSRHLAEAYPDTHASVTLRAVPLREDLVKNHPRLGLFLLGAVALLLLISCANVANLLLARSLSREKEFATRAALGASRARQIRQQITESVLLALFGAALGLALTSGVTDLLATLSVSSTGSLGEFFSDIRIDWRVLVFGVLTAFATAILFGLIPALRASRPDLQSLLKTGGRTDRAAGGRSLRALVVAEVALALVLLTGAGMTFQNLSALRQRNLGYNPENRLIVHLAMPAFKYRDISARLQFVRQLTERVEAIPGIASTGVTHHLPLSDGSDTRPFSVEHGPASEPGNQLLTNIRIVSSGYLSTMGIPLKQGRFFTPEENDGSAPPALIVSEPMALRYWPGENPIGKRMKFGGLDSQSPWRTVVGVVGDVEERYEVEETAYIPYGHAPVGDLMLVARTATDARALANGVRSTIWDIDPDLPVDRVETMRQLVRASFSQERLGTYLIGMFALFGLSIALLGLYGVISYVMGQRTHELGIRIALGSGPPGIIRLVLRQGAALALGGIAVGVPGALLLTRVMATTLAGANPNVPLDVRVLAEATTLEPATYAGLIGLFLAVALLASYLPARRATRIDPVEALRVE
jgi:putative ABC transport system permease protein